MISSYPLLYVPLPGNIPGEYTTPVKNYKVPPKSFAKREKSFETEDVTSIPRWVRTSTCIQVPKVSRCFLIRAPSPDFE